MVSVDGGHLDSVPWLDLKEDEDPGWLQEIYKPFSPYQGGAGGHCRKTSQWDKPPFTQKMLRCFEDLDKMSGDIFEELNILTNSVFIVSWFHLILHSDTFKTFDSPSCCSEQKEN